MKKNMIFPGTLIKSPLLGLLAVFAYLLPAVAWSAGEDGGFKLSLPIACEFGETCWIANYVDLKPGKGVLDYACGDATYDAPPNDMHKGTDFAIRDMEAMRQGVAVKAAAPGVVIAMRDGMADVSFKKIRPSFIKKRECGNAVRIRHDNGMTTQYCHMRRGSVAVRKGDRVSRGSHLGHVGISGLTIFPHLHFQVENGKKVLDPFAGKNRKKKCGVGEN
ncbi:MAG TPA: M23 family metallopeptidase, partial [Rhodospirillales bacterium]|nr:M23 family metallopeptidase [Rhodospirillales bacterium]